MQIKYICPYWGQEGTSPSQFFKMVLEEGYDGVEINMPDSRAFVEDFQTELERIRTTKGDFIFIAQQVLSLKKETIGKYIERMKIRLDELVSLQPDFINSHTGKDYFSFDDNCKAIEVVENIVLQTGIPVMHETHRGRFTFHATTLLPYLDLFPQLKLTADFSHWCTVSESLLDDQHDVIERVIPFVHHIHARVGYAHSPQLNDPFAPEWNSTVEIFTDWWRKIIRARLKTGDTIFTICPEFGPAPYMPTMPITQSPMSDQWVINSRMKDQLKTEFD